MTRLRTATSAFLRALAAAFVCLLVTVPAAPSASAEATLSVSVSTLPSTGASTITVSGRGYLVPPHVAGSSVFGGVYVLFGWVRPGGAWGPSSRNAVNSDGQFGLTYHYPGEGGTGDVRDDGTGTNRFVAFTPGGIDAGSTPFHMDEAGNWSVTLNVGGPVYRWSDPFSGAAATVDCRVVQCGVFTIGAHGRPSPTNERFVPVSFVSPDSPAPNTPAPTAAPAPTGAPGPTATRPAVVGGATTVPARPRSTTASPAPAGAAPGNVPVATPTTTLPADASTTTGAAQPTDPATTTAPVRSGDDTRQRAGGPPPSGSDVIRIAAADDDRSGPTVPFVVAGLGVPAIAGLAVIVRRRSARSA